MENIKNKFPKILQIAGLVLIVGTILFYFFGIVGSINSFVNTAKSAMPIQTSNSFDMLIYDGMMGFIRNLIATPFLLSGLFHGGLLFSLGLIIESLNSISTQKIFLPTTYLLTHKHVIPIKTIA